MRPAGHTLKMGVDFNTREVYNEAGSPCKDLELNSLENQIQQALVAEKYQKCYVRMDGPYRSRGSLSS